ncbi:MAG: M56 family metallopeptidase [Planctomycetes bacterium]|nr:M56 family metallopeptidase [Planctomycetota bacterium]
MMATLFERLVSTSLEVAGLVVLIATLVRLGRRWLTPRATYALWCLVVLRLVVVEPWTLPGGFWSFPNRTFRATTFERSDEPSMRLRRAASTSTATASSSRLRERASPSVDEPADELDSNEGDTLAAAIPRTTPWTEPSIVGTRVVPDPDRSAPLLTTRSGWASLLGWTWLVGAVGLLLRAAIQDARFRMRARRDGRADLAATGLPELLEEGRRAMGIRRPVSLVVTPLIDTPGASGVLRPVLLLPPRVEQLEEADRRNVILHELAHVRRHDLIVNWLLVLLRSLHWFNPFVHVAWVELRESREVLRDFDVLSAQPSLDPRRYARTFLALVGPPPPRVPSPVIGFLHGHGEIRRRILMIRSFETVRSHRIGVFGLAALAVLSWTAFTRAGRIPETPGAAPAIVEKPLIRVERRADDPAWVGELRTRLRHPVDLEASDLPIAEFASWIQAVTDTNVVLMPYVIEQAPLISRVRAHGTPLEHVLAQALRPLDLDYGLYGRAIVIAERGDAPVRLDLRFYDLSPLLNLDDPEEIGERSGRLLDLVRDVVADEADWDREGAQLSYWKGLLCVSQTDRVHERVHQFLEMLARDGDQREQRPEGSRAVRDALQKTLDVHWENTNLADAVELLSSISGVPIALDECYCDNTIDLRLRDVTVAETLGWIQTLLRLRSRIANGAVFLGAEVDTEIRVFDVRDLVREEPSEGENEELDQLSYLIREAVQPARWDDERVGISFYGTRMIVVQSEAVQDELAQFLASMRRALR